MNSNWNSEPNWKEDERAVLSKVIVVWCIGAKLNVVLILCHSWPFGVNEGPMLIGPGLF